MSIFIIMIAGLFLLIIIADAISGGDWGSPCLLALLAFFICTLAELYNAAKYQTELSEKAFLLISGCLLSFCVCSLFVSCCYRSVRGVKKTQQVAQLTRIHLYKWLLVAGLLLSIFTIVLYRHDVSSSVADLGVTGNLNERMAAYRGASAYGDGEDVGVSRISNICFKLLTVIAFVYLYIAINNVLTSGFNGETVLLIIPMIAYVMCQFMLGIRMGAIKAACAFISMYWLLSGRKSEWKRKIKLSSVVKILLGIVIAFLLFWFAAWFVGRKNELGPLDYICSYVGFSFVSLSLFMSQPRSIPALFGQDSFLALYSSIGRATGNSSLVFSGNYEFRSWYGIDLGNVYSLFRPWYSDFGFFGAFVIAAICGICFTVLYEKARRGNPKKSIDIPTVVYSFFAIGFLSMPLVSLLTQTLFTVSTWIFIAGVAAFVCCFFGKERMNDGE